MKDSGRATFDVGNLKVTTVDVSGTYVAEVRPGATERHNKPNFRMRAAVVETPKGPYFIKLTGPAATVKAASPAFDEFLKTLRSEHRQHRHTAHGLHGATRSSRQAIHDRAPGARPWAGVGHQGGAADGLVTGA